MDKQSVASCHFDCLHCWCCWYFFVGIGVYFTTVVLLVVTSTIHPVLGLVFFSSELMALSSLLAWLFAVVTSWFGFLRVRFCDLLPHSVYL